MDSSSVVIKVKYGDTLRRFNALVKGDDHLELNMEELRAKVRSLFNFPLDANFTLTYIDEDGDQVTLAEDEDLHDVVRQELNPVRITVQLDASKGAFSSIPSSGNSTPSRSSAQTFPQNISPKVAEVLKSVPEPILDTVSKLSGELASKAVSADPVVAKFVDNLTKLGQYFLNAPNSHPGATTSNPDEVHVNQWMTSNGTGSAEPGSKSSQAPEVVEGAKGTAHSRSPALSSSFQKGKDASIQYSAGKSVSLKDAEPRFNGKHEKDKVTGDSSVKYGLNAPDLVKGRLESYGSVYGKKRGLKLGATSSPSNFDSCPFSGVRLSPRHDEGLHVPPFQPFNGSFFNADGMGSIFHKGVRCDGCGVLPITGPRFKSRVKHNFDLCNICFTRMGNNSDYTRIDIPLPNRRMFKGFPDPYATPDLNPLKFPCVTRPHQWNHLRPRLDSRFIMDVNVIDGTTVAPSTPFTKIWRMRNNGAIPWSHGLQLLWIGGDRFSSSDSVQIEIPNDGVHVGNEIDIAVDFIAPELPGRYISYWRMAELSGHKFGQRVWVLIQVDASLKEDDSTCESSLSLNLNLPPEIPADINSALEAEKSPIVDHKQKQAIEIGDLNFPINDDLLVGSDVSWATSATSSSLSPPVQADNPTPPVSSLVSQSEVVGDIQSSSAPPLGSYPKESSSTPLLGSYPKESPSAPPLGSYPKESSSAYSSDVEDEKSNPEQNEEKNEQKNGEKNEVEESLLKELAEMGFKQIDLNKEVLRENEYDLERSVDELCGVSEWDPILEELQEMGFHDKAMNKKLLEKNNGSIMRVVMDLISGEQA